MNTEKPSGGTFGLSLASTISTPRSLATASPVTDERNQSKGSNILNVAVVPVSRNLSSKMANMAFCCAVLVVFIHVGTPMPSGTFPWFFIEFFRVILGDIAVPYFFLASGFFLAGHIAEPDWYLREMKKRVWTLLLPYLLWTPLYAVYLYPVRILNNLHAHQSWCWHLGHPDWIWTFGLDFLHSPLLYPFWFLRWLMCLCLASPLLLWFARKTRSWGVSAVYVFAVLEYVRIVYIHLGSWPGWWSWKWLEHLFGVFYFLFGISWRMGLFAAIPGWTKRLPIWLGLTYLVAQLISFVTVGFGIAELDGGVGMFYTKNLLFLTPCLLALVWKCMPSGKWPIWLTGASFGIYAMHPFFINFLNSVLWFGRLGLGEGGMCMFRWVCGLGGSLVGVVVLRKYFPRISKLFLGGR